MIESPPGFRGLVRAISVFNTTEAFTADTTPAYCLRGYLWRHRCVSYVSRVLALRQLTAADSPALTAGATRDYPGKHHGARYWRCADWRYAGWHSHHGCHHSVFQVGEQRGRENSTSPRLLAVRPGSCQPNRIRVGEHVCISSAANAAVGTDADHVWAHRRRLQLAGCGYGSMDVTSLRCC